MYTNAIRKIFTSMNASTLDEAKEQAENTGFSILSFNGIIYVKHKRKQIPVTEWVETFFTIQDFLQE